MAVLLHTQGLSVMRGAQLPGAESLWGRKILAGGPKIPKNVTSTFSNTVYLLPKDLRFEHGDAKLASCPGRYLTSLPPLPRVATSKNETGY